MLFSSGVHQKEPHEPSSAIEVTGKHLKRKFKQILTIFFTKKRE